MTSSKSADAAAIRVLIDKRVEALRAKDADGVVAGHAPEVVPFTLAPPLRQAGDRARAKEGLKAWFATWSGPLGKEDVWARQTLCFERLGGTWKIVHEHISVPFYMDGSVKAAVDLKP
jgi:ketosteroid isomerase-like protein